MLRAGHGKKIFHQLGLQADPHPSGIRERGPLVVLGQLQPSHLPAGGTVNPDAKAWGVISGTPSQPWPRVGGEGRPRGDHDGRAGAVLHRRRSAEEGEAGGGGGGVADGAGGEGHRHRQGAALGGLAPGLCGEEG